MITYSIIQKSQLEGAKRLDAEYYQPEFLLMKNKLMRYKKLVPLCKIADIKTGPAYSGEEIGDNLEIPLAKIGDVTNKINIERWGRLSLREFDKFKNNEVKNGNILMTMTGDPPDVGKVNYIFNKMNNKIAFNQRVAKLSVINSNFNNKYLFAYLSTEIARFQAERASLGIRQRNLGIEDLKNILVVIPSEIELKEVEVNIDNYLSELEKSKTLYSQAENLLLKELKIPLNPPLQKGEIRKTPNSEEKEMGGFGSNVLSCIVNLSDAKSANRFDAEYFESKYKELESRIKNHESKRLGDIVSIKKGIEPGAESYREEGKQFIRVSSLSKYEISDSEQKCLSHELYNKLKADYQPQKGEILLTKDASPGIAYVVKENIEGIISSGILRLKLRNKEIEDEYLALCLNSIIGKMQAQRDAGGSVIMHWKPEEIKNVIIPILPKLVQQKISSLVRQSFESRIKAKALLEEAKLKVEEMIEKKSSNK